MNNGAKFPFFDPAEVGRAMQGLANHVQQFGDNLQTMRQQAVTHVSTSLHNFGKHIEQNLHQHLKRRKSSIGGVRSPLASVSLGQTSRQAQPLYTISYNPLEIQGRLAGVVVYTIANKNKEFVLVSGQGSKQLGLFFFNESDAKGMIDKMMSENPKLARQSQVLAVTLDKVYEYAVTPRDKLGENGVYFRFMPDMKQVQYALELHTRAGHDTLGFTGVPVFQAEGLTVKGEKSRYTPIFFDKEDLNVAISNAFQMRDVEGEKSTKAKAERAAKDFQKAKQEYESASKSNKAAAQQRLELASARVLKYDKRLKELNVGPQIEVGCLEEVLEQMETDSKGQWDDVMFIPPGALTAAAASQEANK